MSDLPILIVFDDQPGYTLAARAPDGTLRRSFRTHLDPELVVPIFRQAVIDGLDVS